MFNETLQVHVCKRIKLSGTKLGSGPRHFWGLCILGLGLVKARFKVRFKVSIGGRVRVRFFGSFRIRVRGGVRVRFWLGPGTRLDVYTSHCKSFFTPLQGAVSTIICITLNSSSHHSIFQCISFE